MRRTASPIAAVLAALLLLAPGALEAQGTSTPALPREAGRILRGARSAQAAFERLRFRHLPWTWHSGGGECDERIGRFCLWHNEGGTDWVPPPEPEAVREGREALIARLDTAAARLPGDDWVAGQRVRYLVEAGRRADAIAAAAECRATRWWCLALEGMTLHAAAEYGAADSAFARALAEMPEKEREEWTELAPILSGGEWSAFKRLRQEMPERAERRFWWLSDPLWSDAGNDRRTEHYARLVVDRLQDRARSTEGISWGSDLREILLRYGAPVGWERVHPSNPMLSQRVSVVTHYAPRSWRFLPPVRHLGEPGEIGPEDWKTDERSAHTEYAPAYADRFDALEHQVALFRRGDSAVVVAAYALDPDSVPAGAATEAALVLAADESAEPRVARASATGARGVLRLETPPGTVVMSLETRTAADSLRRLGRARYGLAVPSPDAGVAVSDVLLLADPDPLPTTLEEAFPRARGTTRVEPEERLGLFWEVYGLSPRPDTVALAIQVRKEDTGWLRRAAQGIGLVDPAAPVRVRWEEETAGEPVLTRSLLLALPALAPGRYVLELSVTPRGATEPVTVSRELRVER